MCGRSGCMHASLMQLGAAYRSQLRELTDLEAAKSKDKKVCTAKVFSWCDDVDRWRRAWPSCGSACQRWVCMRR